MLGTLRLVLAILVVFNHLWLPTANRMGAHAVTGFYLISGYLMTRVVNETYHGRGGFTRFLANRVLRIFPFYWLAVAATTLGLWLLPQAFGNLSSLMQLPLDPRSLLANLTLVDLPWVERILVPPSWSLSIEFVFYLLIGLGMSRRPGWTAAWWLASVAYTVLLVAQGAPFGVRYTPPAAASLFFASGALLYHLRARWQAFRLPAPVWSGATLLFATAPLLCEHLFGDRLVIGFYGAFALFLPIFCASINAAVTAPVRAYDDFLGSLAYPVFLTHYFAAGVVNVLSRGAVHPLGLAHCLCALATCLALSVWMVRHLEPAIDLVRGRIRPRHGAPARPHTAFGT